MKITIEPKKDVEIKISESRPHGGLAPLPGCPVCESLDNIYRKDRNKKKAITNMDKMKE